MAGSEDTVDVRIIANIDELKEALGLGARETHERAHEMAEAFNEVRESLMKVAEFVGVAFGLEEIKEFAEQAYETAEKLDHLTQSLGITAQTAQTMAFAAGMVGADMDTAANAMTRLERSAELASAGSLQQAEAFRALGISGTQLADLLKHPDEMFKTVAEDINKFADGPAKVALSIELFGRNAAQILPFLKEFGGNFEEAKEKAEALGVVLSEENQRILVQTQEEMNLAAQAAKGLGNQLGVALAPAFREAAEAFTALVSSDAAHSFFKTMGDDIAEVIVLGKQIKGMFVGIGTDLINSLGPVKSTIGNLFADMGGDVVSFIQEAQDDFSRLGAGVKQIWYEVEAAALTIWNEIANAFNAVIKGVLISIASVADWESGLYAKLHLTALSDDMAGVSKSLTSMADGFKQNTTYLDGVSAAIDQNREDLIDSIHAHAMWAEGARASADALRTVAGATEDAGKKQLDYTAKVKDSSQQVSAFAKEELAMATQLDALSSDLEGPYAKAWEQYSIAFDKVEKFLTTAKTLYSEGKISIEEYNADVAIGRDLEGELAQKYANTTQAIKDQHDEMEAGRAKLDELRQLMGVSIQQQTAMKAALDEYDKLLKSHYDFYGNYIADETELKAALDAQLPSYIALQQKVADYDQALKNNQQILKDWEGVATNAFDSAFSAINKDIIEGGSVMKDLVNVAKQVVEAILMEFEKLAIINPLLNQIFGLSGSSALPTSSFGSIINNIGGMFGGGGASAGGMGNGSIMNLLGGGNSNLLSNVGSWLGFGGGTLDAGMSVASGFGSMGSADALGLVPDYAGVGGAFDMGGSAATYGTTLGESAGSSFLSSVGPMLGGFALGDRLGGTGGGIALAAASYFVPVIGWIAGAISLVDSLTGGGLLGTSWKPTGTVTTDVNVGQSGASVEDWINESKKGSLFSGRKWRNVQVDPTQDQVNAYNQAFGTEQTAIDAAAKALGVTVGDEITGSWSAVTDKTGKVVSQTTEVMGQKYSEDAQHFFERLTADNEISLLPASDALTKFTQQFEANADQLQDAATMLVAAQVDINKGMSLISGDTNLGDIGTLVQSLQQGSETLTQTYVRLQTETQSFQATLDALGLHINATGADFVKFADSAAAAAGGIDKLDNELAQLYQLYTPVNVQNQNALDQQRKSTQDALKAIGEDPTESMAQFWMDFQKAMPNLSPDDLQKWIQAGLQLGSYTQAVTNSANAMQQLADYNVQLYGDQFVSAMAGAVEWEKKQIDTANQLAQAAGLAGASQQQLSEIMTDGTLMMGKAIADLTTGIYSDINTLYSVLAPAQNSADAYTNFGLSLGGTHPITGPDPAAQKAAQQQSTAFDLLAKLGDLEYAEGKTATQVLSQFGLNADQLASILGISPDQVKKDIDAQAQNDKAMLTQVAQGAEMVGLLQDLVDIAQGRAPSYDWTGLGGQVQPSGDISGSKPGAGTHIAVGPKAAYTANADTSTDTAKPIVDATNTNGSATVAAINRLADAFNRHSDMIDRALRAGGLPGGARNTTAETFRSREAVR